MRSSCKTCVSSYWKRSRHVRTDEQVSASKVRSRKHQLKRYGLSLDQYNEMIESQNGVCAICHKVMDSPHVDHNHETGHTVSATHILATPGNHDWVKEFPPECRSKMFIDEGCNVQDLYRDRTLKFWFTPWVSGLPMWNYSLTRERRRDRFDMIPRGLDVLVSHAPAYHIGDKTMSGEHAGCIELRTAIDRARPKHCFYGHIHEGQRQGQKHVPFGQTQMHNVSMWLAETEPVEITL